MDIVLTTISTVSTVSTGKMGFPWDVLGIIHHLCTLRTYICMKLTCKKLNNCNYIDAHPCTYIFYNQPAINGSNLRNYIEIIHTNSRIVFYRYKSSDQDIMHICRNNSASVGAVPGSGSSGRNVHIVNACKISLRIGVHKYIFTAVRDYYACARGCCVRKFINILNEWYNCTDENGVRVLCNYIYDFIPGLFAHIYHHRRRWCGKTYIAYGRELID